MRARFAHWLAVLLFGSVLLQGCAGAPSSNRVAGTNFYETEHDVAGQQFVFGSSDTNQSSITLLVSAGDAMAKAARSVPNAHIWVGSQFVADIGPGSKPVESLVVSEAEAITSQTVQVSDTYVENEYKINPRAPLAGSLAVAVVGTWLVPSFSLDQVGPVLARKLGRFSARAFIIQRVAFDNSLLMRLIVFPNSTKAAAEYSAFGDEVSALLLHEGYSTQETVGTELLAA